MEPQTQTTKKKQDDVAKNGAAVTEVVPDIGDTSGFEKVSLDIDGFYPMEAYGKVNPIRGLLLARIEKVVDGEERTVYIIRLTAPCYAIRGRGDEKETFIADKGMHIQVDEKAKLKQFIQFLPKRTDRGVSANEVVFKPTKKIKLRGGKTMWTGEPMARELSQDEVKKHGLLAIAKIGEAPKLLGSGREEASDDDDMPF